MRIIEENKKKTVVLDDGDLLYVKTLKGNPLTLKIECNDGRIYVDEVLSKRIKEIRMEQQQLEALNRYNHAKEQEKE